MNKSCTEAAAWARCHGEGDTPLKQFRTVDMILFSLMALVAGVVSDIYIGQLSTAFYYSLKTAVCLIVMIRWGKYGAIPIFVASLGAVALSDMVLIEGLLYHCLADLCLVMPILIYGPRDRNKLMSPWYRTVGYVTLSHISLAVGKGIAIFLVAGEVTGVIDYFAANVMILVMDCIVLLVMRNITGLVVDVENLMMREGTVDGQSIG